MNQDVGHDPAPNPSPSTHTEYDPAAYWSKRLGDSEGLEAVGWQGLGRSFNGWLYRRRAAVFRQVARAYG